MFSSCSANVFMVQAANALELEYPALASRLQVAEKGLAKLKAESSRMPKGSVQKLMPRLADEYRALVDDLATSLTSVNVNRARAEMRRLSERLRSKQRLTRLGYCHGRD